MKTVIWPRTDGDVVVDLREVLSDGEMRAALVVVDTTGAVKTLGKVLEVRDGGGHIELHRFLISEDTGFDRNGDGKVLVHPENV
jgi:hypothetical protein